MADPVSTSESNSFIISVDDTSPSVLYLPFADTFAAPNLSAGWYPYFIPAATSDNSSEETTLHATVADGASIGLRWNGES